MTEMRSPQGTSCGVCGQGPGPCHCPEAALSADPFWRLARRLVNLPGWRWTPGMREVGDGLRVVQAWDVGGVLWASEDDVDGGDWVHEGRIPDLSDAATIGAAYAVWQSHPGHRHSTPCPIMTMASAFGITDIRTAEALVKSWAAGTLGRA